MTTLLQRATTFMSMKQWRQKNYIYVSKGPSKSMEIWKNMIYFWQITVCISSKPSPCNSFMNRSTSKPSKSYVCPAKTQSRSPIGVLAWRSMESRWPIAPIGMTAETLIRLRMLIWVTWFCSFYRVPTDHLTIDDIFPSFQTLHSFDEFTDFEHGEDPLVSMMKQRIMDVNDPTVSVYPKLVCGGHFGTDVPPDLLKPTPIHRAGIWIKGTHPYDYHSKFTIPIGLLVLCR